MGNQRCAWLLLMSLAALGCDDGGGGDDLDGRVGDGGIVDAEPPSPECVRVPEQIAAGVACLDDVGCPCGTHCVVGVCEAECTTNDDCADGRCDRFGRCTTTDGPPAVHGRITVAPRLIDVVDANEAGVFAIGADGADLGPVRIVAEAALTLECLAADGSAMPADEGVCRFDALPADGTRLQVRARLTDGATVGSVRIFAGTTVEVVNLRLITQAPPPVEQVPGFYRGVARLQAVGARHLMRNEITTGAVPPGVVSAPVEVDIAADGRVRILDIGRAITPHGELLGQMAFAGADVFGDAQFEPWHHAVDGAWSPPDAARLPCGDAAYACDGEWGDGADQWTVWGSAAIPADGLRVTAGAPPRK